MSTLNADTSSRNKRKFDDIIAISQEEYENALARKDSLERKEALPQAQEDEINTKHQAVKFSADAHDPKDIINQIPKDPLNAAAFRTHGDAARVQRKPQMTKEQYDSHTTRHRNEWRKKAMSQVQRIEINTEHQAGINNTDAYDPNTKINQSIQDPFKAAFAAHEQPPIDLKKMIREELYNHSITAPPGEWTGSLPYHPDARERIDAWIQQTLPEDLDERQYWDDLDYWATNLSITPWPTYPRESQIGKLERYRFKGHLEGERFPEQPASWKQMLALEALTGATTLKESERRQQEIRGTREVQGRGRVT